MHACTPHGVRRALLRGPVCRLLIGTCNPMPHRHPCMTHPMPDSRLQAAARRQSSRHPEQRLRSEGPEALQPPGVAAAVRPDAAGAVPAEGLGPEAGQLEQDAAVQDREERGAANIHIVLGPFSRITVSQSANCGQKSFFLEKLRHCVRPFRAHLSGLRHPKPRCVTCSTWRP